MSKSRTKEPERKEKELYTCPCGFCSYDLMEFLKHPYLGDTEEQNELEIRMLERNEG